MFGYSTIVTRSRNHCYHGNGTIRLLCIVYLHVAVIDVVITEGGAMETQQCLPLTLSLIMSYLIIMVIISLTVQLWI
jgi:hypothetical protein